MKYANCVLVKEKSIGCMRQIVVACSWPCLPLASAPLPLWLTRIGIFAKRAWRELHQIVVICYRRSYKHGSYANYDWWHGLCLGYAIQWWWSALLQTGCKQASAKCSTSHEGSDGEEEEREWRLALCHLVKRFINFISRSLDRITRTFITCESSWCAVQHASTAGEEKQRRRMESLGFIATHAMCAGCSCSNWAEATWSVQRWRLR